MANAADADVSFEMKDQQFQVLAKLEDAQEIYDGAVVSAKLKTAPAGSGVRHATGYSSDSRVPLLSECWVS